MDAGDAVTCFDDGPDIHHRQLGAELFDLPLDNRGYVLTCYCHTFYSADGTRIARADCIAAKPDGP